MLSRDLELHNLLFCCPVQEEPLQIREGTSLIRRPCPALDASAGCLPGLSHCPLLSQHRVCWELLALSSWTASPQLFLKSKMAVSVLLPSASRPSPSPVGTSLPKTARTEAPPSRECPPPHPTPPAFAFYLAGRTQQVCRSFKRIIMSFFIAFSSLLAEMQL